MFLGDDLGFELIRENARTIGTMRGEWRRPMASRGPLSLAERKCRLGIGGFGRSPESLSLSCASPPWRCPPKGFVSISVLLG